MASKKNDSITCVHHIGLSERINGFNDRLDSMDSKNFVPSITFRWVIGILIAVIFSLNSFTIKTLIDVKLQQHTMIHKMERLYEIMGELKQKHKEQAVWIKKKLSEY